MGWRTAPLPPQPRRPQRPALRVEYSSRFLLPAADPPGDLHVGLVGRDREAALLELRGDAGAAWGLEVPQLVLERRLERLGLDREPDGGEPIAIRPHLS